jgi:hypothetical protein
LKAAPEVIFMSIITRQRFCTETECPGVPHDWYELNLLWECPGHTDLTQATPVAIDTEISRLENVMSVAGLRLISLRREFGEAKVQAAGHGASRRVRSVEEITADIEATDKIRFATHHQLSPLYDEFIRRGGWTRWYLVSDGHLHYDISGDRCSRIPTTDHYWMTEHSGRSAAEMIELAGDRVCTSCFPDAPVAPRPATARFMTPSEAERAAYREAQARKKAAAKAAQPTTPEGGVLYTVYTAADGELRNESSPVKTLMAARRQLMENATSLAIWFGSEHAEAPVWRENIERMLAAIAHATGMDLNTVRVETRNKITKKARREGLPVLVEV